jgi:hypothetical protein
MIQASERVGDDRSGAGRCDAGRSQFQEIKAEPVVVLTFLPGVTFRR